MLEVLKNSLRTVFFILYEVCSLIAGKLRESDEKFLFLLVVFTISTYGPYSSNRWSFLLYFNWKNILKIYPQTSFFYVYQHQQPKCLICEQSFTNMVSTIQHTHVHAERRLSCTLCRIICRGRYELQEHTKKCHVTVSLSTKPKVSPKKFMETSASTSADILCCPVCLDYYDVEEEYEEHIKTHFSNTVSGGF